MRTYSCNEYYGGEKQRRNRYSLETRNPVFISPVKQRNIQAKAQSGKHAVYACMGGTPTHIPISTKMLVKKHSPIVFNITNFDLFF